MSSGVGHVRTESGRSQVNIARTCCGRWPWWSPSVTATNPRWGSSPSLNLVPRCSRKLRTPDVAAAFKGPRSQVLVFRIFGRWRRLIVGAKTKSACVGTAPVPDLLMKGRKIRLPSEACGILQRQDVSDLLSTGYDDPIGDESADLLGRAGFSREIASLAIAGPVGWSSRIGIYGRWGEGKTSVMRLARSILDGQGHLVADFNPWGCRSSEEMIELLATELLSLAKRAKLEVPGVLRRGGKWLAGLVGRTASKADNLQLPGPAAVAQPIVAATARISPWLERWARDRKEDIEQVVQVVDLNRRIVVFVDDVDRLDPKLLPGLLFALHDVFALAGVTFIVALDPAVVGKALQEYHRGFGDGVAFLEKIVQFPRWLPPVSAEQRLRVAEFDRRQYAPFLSASTLEVNQDILPNNPREVRMLIRGLLPMRRAFERHGSDELDQNLLLLVECFRQRFPLTLAMLLENEALLNKCSAFFAKDDSGDALLKGIHELARRSGEVVADSDEERDPRLRALVGAMSGRSIFWNASSIRYHAFLMDRPHAVTWREFRPLLSAAGSDGPAIDEWIRAQAVRVGASLDDVANELFDCVIRSYRKAMDESADAASESEHEAVLARVAAASAMVRTLWFSSKFSAFLRTPTRFHHVLSAFRGWAYFVLNPGDRAARAYERELLLEIVRASVAPLQFLEKLGPWEPNDLKKESTALTNELKEILLEQVAPLAVAKFGEPSGIAAALRSDQLGYRYVLSMPKPMWAAEQRRRLETLAGANREVVAENVRGFLETLVENAKVRAGEQDLLDDRELVELLWRLVTGVRWQARFFRGFEALKKALEKSVPLPEPSWWADARAVAYPGAIEEG